MERSGVITFKGNPLTLVGPQIKVGYPSPDFTVVDGDLKPVKLSDFKGQLVIISSVPSLDTPVCEMQTKRFNQEAAKLDAKVLSISMDLPFAQKRFCNANSVENVLVLSDYMDHDFAKTFGLLIKELRLLARAVLIIDKKGKVAYIQIVKEVATEPDYDAVLKEVAKLTG